MSGEATDGPSALEDYRFAGQQTGKHTSNMAMLVSVVAAGEDDVLGGANAILFDPPRLGMAPPELHLRLAWLLD